MQEVHGHRYGAKEEEPDRTAQELAEIKATLAALMEARNERSSAQ